MLAALLYGPEDLRIEEYATPEINENEVLLEVKRAAICGTDVRMFKNGYTGISASTPRILGHEISGVIKEVGKNITKYQPGMRITAAPNMGCGQCARCVGGNTHLCKEYQALGININGGFTQYVRIPEAAVRQGNITLLKDHVTFEEAAIVEPLACVYNGFQQVNVKPGDFVLIIGAGPIGLMHAKLAKMAGASKVIINDISEERLAMCREIDDAITTVSTDLKPYIMELTNGEGVDVLITACPVPQVQSSSLDLMAIGGRINFFGGLPKDKEIVPLNTNIIHYKQLIVTGSTRSSILQFRKALEFVENKLVDVKPLISASFTLNQIDKAFEHATRGIGLKNIITVN
ncbi:zinc-dependent dehydrogenase [Paenibacillus radicis (ex Xue et al. 2023)]|uniref:Zinc-dependent dehydrogenase n=1 Tax=Paenibacillus radicis (ex Xue et al. 2023) TaxID=2972489 RepID=A0ABT1YIQ4_9BACL|nr:zinc-dependent dehydrogenase [Paenibacillus radicis (ex Xue et al. 2023)]MCR8633053.1 zinc-dependent dehydrogenase [Paenibacillus radicis (ex Xue et al. 2023)]